MEPEVMDAIRQVLEEAEEEEGASCFSSTEHADEEIVAALNQANYKLAIRMLSPEDEDEDALQEPHDILAVLRKMFVGDDVDNQQEMEEMVRKVV